MEIVESGSIITAYDSPTSVIKSKQDSSMAVGLSLLADGKATRLYPQAAREHWL